MAPPKTDASGDKTSSGSKPDGAKGERVEWTTHPHVVRTIADDSFRGWEDALVEAIKNSLDAGATRIDLRLPDSEVLVPLHEQVVEITDDGSGMTRDELEQDYCRIGRPCKQKAGYGRRGTGKIANFVVAHKVRLETWRDGEGLAIEFPTDAVMRASDQDRIETPIEVVKRSDSSSGTTIRVSEFRQNLSPPSTGLAESTILRHFHHEDVPFFVNGERFIASDHAEVVSEMEHENVGGVGTISGRILIAKKKLQDPGIVLYVDGQHIHGPSLLGLDQKGYRGDVKKTVDGMLGKLDLVPVEPLPSASVFTLSPQFKALESWLAPKLEELVDSRSAVFIEDRLDHLLTKDPATSKMYEKLEDSQKAMAKRLLRPRAKKASESAKGYEQEKVISRLVVRSIQVAGLNTVLTALDEAEDETVEILGEVLGGEDPWTLRQVAMASSLMKQRQAALDKLEKCVSDYEKNESAIHKILEANPWIIADDFHSFRSNRQIKTTLKTLFKLDTDDPAALKRPDFFFVLGDAASSSLEQSSRFLFVELKGPDQPLVRDHQNQVIGDAMTLTDSRPGFVSAVLLGVEFAKSKPPDEEADSKGKYTFRSMTYQRLLERARFRLGYMMDGVETTKAEEFVKKVIEHEIGSLVGK